LGLIIFLNAPCPMPHAMMPHALCPMPHAPCPLPHAPCPIHYFPGQGVVFQKPDSSPFNIFLWIDAPPPEIQYLI
jgi:hypothetical protein